MDPLTALFELLRPRALPWKHLMARGDWAWRMPADPGVVFGRVIDGRCRYEVPRVGRGWLESGDYFLLTAPPPWLLRSPGDTEVIVDFESLPVHVLSASANDDREAGVRIIGGHFTFDSVNTDLLLPFLSPVVHIAATEGRESGRLERVLTMIDAEASVVRPGQDAVLSRMLEIVLIELLRAPEMLTGLHRGMLTGLTHPQIGAALRAFHSDISRNWSVVSLAAVATMSRSVFSERFTALIGRPAMTYVLQWRMAVGKDLLRSGGQSLDEIAMATGYGSASAFSTAFTRTVRSSPARFARGLQQNATYQPQDVPAQ